MSTSSAPCCAFSCTLLAAPELAADLTAETFARALESVASYDPSRGEPINGYSELRATCWRRATGGGGLMTRHACRLGLPALMLDDHSAQTIARLSAGRDKASRALAGLPVGQREAIEARVLEERDYGEIASELDCSEALVRQRVSRGLRALRTRLAGER